MRQLAKGEGKSLMQSNCIIKIATVLLKREKTGNAKMNKYSPHCLILEKLICQSWLSRLQLFVAQCLGNLHSKQRENEQAPEPSLHTEAKRRLRNTCRLEKLNDSKSACNKLIDKFERHIMSKALKF